MADTSSNVQFKVENGFLALGTANIAGPAGFNGNVDINGTYLSITANLQSNIIPTNNTYSIGNSTSRWILNAMTGNFVGAVTVTNTVASGNTTITGFANVSSTLNVTGATTVNGATTINNTLATGNTSVTGFANISSTLNVVGAATVNGAATINNTLATGNTSVTGFINVSSTANVGGATTLRSTLVVDGATTINNTLLAGNTTVNGFANVIGALVVGGVSTFAGNATFDTDLLFVDAVNNRIGFKNAAPASDLISINGNTVITSANAAIRFLTGNATHNAHVSLSGNTTNTRLTVTTYEANATASDGGFLFQSVNSTATTAVLQFNQAEFKYKAGNVAHAGNFGIYDVSGTRLGP